MYWYQSRSNSTLDSYTSNSRFCFCIMQGQMYIRVSEHLRRRPRSVCRPEHGGRLHGYTQVSTGPQIRLQGLSVVLSSFWSLLPLSLYLSPRDLPLSVLAEARSPSLWTPIYVRATCWPLMEETLDYYYFCFEFCRVWPARFYRILTTGIVVLYSWARGHVNDICLVSWCASLMILGLLFASWSPAMMTNFFLVTV